MRQDISDAFLRTVEPPQQGRIELRDARVPGLVLRITKNGIATWSVRLRTKDGKHTRPKLGTWPTLGVAEARRQAKTAIGAIVSGADPVAQKREARAARKARAAEASVAQRAAAWQAAKVADANAPWSANYADHVAGIIKRDILPKLGRRPLVETTRADWTAIVAAKRKAAPAAAAALYRVASSFLSHAEAEGWIDAPLLPRRGAARLAPQPAARDRVLTDAELTEVWRVADREAPRLRAFTRLLILTAAREREVAGMKLGEVDRDAGRWTLPGERSKNRKAYTVPLGPLALAELGAVWPDEAEADHHLLGRTGGAPFSGFSRLKARLDAALTSARAREGREPMPPWRIHDLRRTARSGMARLGVPRDHAEAALNHLSARSALERTYDRHDYGPEIVAALTLWQGHVAGLVGQAAVVVPLAEARASRSAS